MWLNTRHTPLLRVHLHLPVRLLVSRVRWLHIGSVGSRIPRMIARGGAVVAIGSGMPRVMMPLRSILPPPCSSRRW